MIGSFEMEKAAGVASWVESGCRMNCSLHSCPSVHDRTVLTSLALQDEEHQRCWKKKKKIVVASEKVKIKLAE